MTSLSESVNEMRPSARGSDAKLSDPCFSLHCSFAPFLVVILVQTLKAPVAGEPSWVEHGLAHYAFYGLPGSSGWMGSAIFVVLMI